MTNKEKYKQAFSAVKLSEDFSWEGSRDKTTGINFAYKRGIAAAIIAAVVVCSGGAVYAADVGGVQRTVQLWVHGEQTDVTIDLDGNGNYTMEYPDEDGNAQTSYGGGVTINNNGSVDAVLDEDLMEYLSEPEVDISVDGSVWIYWYDQHIDITDKFEDDVCYAQLEKAGETVYMTIVLRDNDDLHYAMDSSKYPNISKFGN